MPRNDFYNKPAPESEDDLEVPGQPFLGLLGILSEYYKYKEPNHKQGKALANALKYLYRVKPKTSNGAMDEDFGLEILNAVENVVVNTKPVEAPSSQGEPSTSAEPDTAEPLKREPDIAPAVDDFSDFGFSSSDSSSDGLGSKIDDLVRMVKNTVKKKKKKKKRDVSPALLPDDKIPTLKIRFSKTDESEGEGNSTAPSTTPMKLKIKLGGVTPLLPPPPLLTLHPSSPEHSPHVRSPHYEAQYPVLKEEEPPRAHPPPIKPLKLTLRVQQPSPDRPRLVIPTATPAVPAPVAVPALPKLKMAPPSPHKGDCRKRKRGASPKHPSSPAATANTASVPTLKVPRLCIRKDPLVEPSPDKRPLKKKKIVPFSLTIENKHYWKCGIFSNSLKQENPDNPSDELDFRSNILPIYCGINYMKKKSDFVIPYDICWRNEHGLLPKPRYCTNTEGKLEEILREKKFRLPPLSECEYVFDEHIDKRKKGKKGGSRKGGKKAAKRQTSVPAATTVPGPPEEEEQPDSPCESPGLVIQSDCDSPLPMKDGDPLEGQRSPSADEEEEEEEEEEGEGMRNHVRDESPASGSGKEEKGESPPVKEEGNGEGHCENSTEGNLSDRTVQNAQSGSVKEEDCTDQYSVVNHTFDGTKKKKEEEIGLGGQVETVADPTIQSNHSGPEGAVVNTAETAPSNLLTDSQPAHPTPATDPASPASRNASSTAPASPRNVPFPPALRCGLPLQSEPPVLQARGSCPEMAPSTLPPDPPPLQDSSNYYDTEPPSSYKNRDDLVKQTPKTISL